MNAHTWNTQFCHLAGIQKGAGKQNILLSPVPGSARKEEAIKLLRDSKTQQFPRIGHKLLLCLAAPQWDYCLSETSAWSSEFIWETLCQSLPIIMQAIKWQQRPSFSLNIFNLKKICKSSQCDFPFLNCILFLCGKDVLSRELAQVQSKV